MNIRYLFKKEQQQDFVMEDAFDRIRESRAFAEECSFDLEQLHCKGCIYTCPLSRAKCDTGRRAVPLFEKCRK